MQKSLVIVGAASMAREIYAYALEVLSLGGSPGFDRIGGFVDLGPNAGEQLAGFGVEYDFVDSLDSHTSKPEFVYVTGVGSPAEKRRAVEALPAGVEWANVIHPTAYVAASARLGHGVVLAPFTFAGIDSRLGDHVTLNAYASCGHDSVVGRYCVLSPYAAITGRVVMGEEVFLGTHVGVTPRVTLGTRCRVAAGSTVTRDAEAGSLLVGNPAKGRVMYRLDD
jgi:sugar O-acyltransferase (sialic acid O-acetyltransferase NeuD family)